mgnify:CR=1 FL=1
MQNCMLNASRLEALTMNTVVSGFMEYTNKLLAIAKAEGLPSSRLARASFAFARASSFDASFAITIVRAFAVLRIEKKRAGKQNKRYPKRATWETIPTRK